MDRTVLFEGKTLMGGMDVEIKIYKFMDGEYSYYEWDYNPHLVDESQADVHIGEINRGMDLETIFFRINMYKDDIKKIKAIKDNPDF